MISTLKIAALAFGACFVTVSHARDCPKPPLRHSQQAVCYAMVYAEKNGLPHARPLTKRVTKTAKLWTVHFADRPPNTRGGGWEVDIDAATGTVTRFRGFKPIQK